MILRPDKLDTLSGNWFMSAPGLSGLHVEPNVAEFGAVIAELMVVANMGLFKD
jgi:hypothetical protein